MKQRTKQCSHCNKHRQLRFFSVKKLGAKGQALFQSACKVCRVVQQRDRLSHPARRLEHQERVRLHKSKLRDFVAEMKNRPCADCGQTYPSYVMDFDHVRGEKLGNVSSMTTRGSRRLLEDEIKKCDVVCANCHRERTHGDKVPSASSNLAPVI